MEKVGNWVPTVPKTSNVSSLPPIIIPPALLILHFITDSFFLWVGEGGSESRSERKREKSSGRGHPPPFYTLWHTFPGGTNFYFPKTSTLSTHLSLSVLNFKTVDDKVRGDGEVPMPCFSCRVSGMSHCLFPLSTCCTSLAFFPPPTRFPPPCGSRESGENHLSTACQVPSEPLNEKYLKSHGKLWVWASSSLPLNCLLLFTHGDRQTYLPPMITKEIFSIFWSWSRRGKEESLEKT